MSNHVTICEDLFGFGHGPSQNHGGKFIIVVRNTVAKKLDVLVRQTSVEHPNQSHIGRHSLQAEAIPLQDMRKKQYWDTTRVITPDELINQQLVSTEFLLEPWQL